MLEKVKLVSVVRTSDPKKHTVEQQITPYKSLSATDSFTISESLWEACSGLRESGDSGRGSV